jgi:DNA-binding Xre family transcriptional regulator
MLKFDLKKAMLEYQARTGLRMSYEILSEDTGVSTETLKSIATREGYNATFKIVSIISISLGINPIEYLEWSNE